jgi:hypothetical protein
VKEFAATSITRELPYAHLGTRSLALPAYPGIAMPSVNGAAGAWHATTPVVADQAKRPPQSRGRLAHT